MSSSVSQLFVRWEEALERGQELSPEQLCADRPELVEEVRRGIEALRQMRHRVEETATVPPRDDPEATTPPSPVTVAIGGMAPVGYEVVGELGRGGMGVVYKARQVALNRLCALKMILAGGHAGEGDRARFLGEAKAIAKVKHTGIVQVYDFGTHEGLPYFSLELCEGGSLADQLRDGPLAAVEAAGMVERIAWAVQAAHGVGIVHRDLKPGNVLLAADGSPRVTDFGLAKRIEGGGQTQTGAVMGTPSYMAPEQAQGSKDVGPLADVWALGAILYECLSGRPPFRAATSLDTILQVVADEPVPLRQLNGAVPVDLETICHKCMQKDPGKRYGSAGALAEDLRRFGEGRPIAARPVGRVECVWRWCARNPVLAVLCAMALLCALAALGAISIGYWQVSLARNALEVERDKALQGEMEATRLREQEGKSRQEAVLSLRASLLSQAQALRQSQQPGSRSEALRVLKRAAAIRPGSDLRDEYLRCLELVELRPLRDLPVPDLTDASHGLTDAARQITDPREKEDAIRGFWFGGPAASTLRRNLLRFVSSNGRTMNYDLSAGKVLSASASLSKLVEPRALSADGRIFVGTEPDPDPSSGRRQPGTATRVWDLNSGKLLGELRDAKGNRVVATSIALSDGGDLLAAANDHRGKWTICVYDVKSMNVVAQWEVSATVVDCLKFTPDGKLLAASIIDNPTHFVRVWEIPTGKVLATLPTETRVAGSTFIANWQRRLDFSRDGRLLAAGGSNGTVRVWDMTRREIVSGQNRSNIEVPYEIFAVQGHTHGVVVAQFSPTDRWLATADLESGGVKLWEAYTGRFVAETNIGPSLIGVTQLTKATVLQERSCVQWLTANTLLTEKGRVWEVIPPVSQLFPFRDITNTSRGAPLYVQLCFSPKEEWLVCRPGDRFDSLLVNLRTPDSDPVSLKALPYLFAFSPDGKTLWAVGDLPETDKLWQLPSLVPKSKKRDVVKREAEQSTRAIAFNEQGERIAAVWMKKRQTLTVWNLDTGKELANLGNVGGRFSPDWTSLVSIEWKGQKRESSTKVVDLSTGADLFHVILPGGEQYDLRLQVALASQARRVAIATRDRIIVYDPKTRQRIADLRGHKGDVWHLEFDESANLLASTAADRTARLWRVDTGELLATMYTGHEQRAWVALSPSGKWLAVGDRGGHVRLWDLFDVRHQLRDAGLDWSQVPNPVDRVKPSGAVREQPAQGIPKN